jgi:carbon storage regulator
MVSHPLQPQRRPADGGFGRTSKEERTVLIITRKAGQKIMLGDDVVIQVIEIVGGSARPGIEAPRSVPVYREEIWEAVRRDGGAVAVPSPDELPSRPSA